MVVQLNSYVVNVTLYILFDSVTQSTTPIITRLPMKKKRKKRRYHQTCSHVVVIEHEKRHSREARERGSEGERKKPPTSR